MARRSGLAARLAIWRPMTPTRWRKRARSTCPAMPRCRWPRCGFSRGTTEMLRVGVIDSGPGPKDRLGDARAFMADGSAVAARPDRLGHGTAVAAMIRRACPGAAIIHAQVFDDRPVTSAFRVAAALRWFAAMGDARPEVICMSLGLAADRTPLRLACEALVTSGAVLVAAYPARGAPCYPAAYPGVIAATGDARCGWRDLSQLG